MNIHIKLADHSYDVRIGLGVLDELGAHCKRVGLGKRALLVTNESVGNLYGHRAIKSLHEAGFEVGQTVVDDGEEHKTIGTVAALYDACVTSNLDRGSFIVALGGGVIGDIAGFVAATYMRGIRFVQCPTTLLAQVDASVGGKTGVNHPKGKNMIGAFHQPSLVLADVNTLHTLPDRQFTAGLAEVVKHGLIKDEALFHYCEGAVENLVSRDERAMADVVYRSVEIKRDVVVVDEREQGLRAILNFGHSVGHAIEAVTEYGTWTHGEAISLGMMVEGRLSVMQGLLKEDDLDRIRIVLTKLHLPVAFDGPDVDDILSAMHKDKKNRDGKLTLVLLNQIGQASIRESIDTELVRQAFGEIVRDPL